VPLTFPVETPDPFYDPDNLVQNGVFIAPFGGVFTIRMQLVVKNDTLQSNNGSYILHGFSINGTFGNQFFGDSTIADGYYQVVAHESTVTLEAGDEVAFWIYYEGSFASGQAPLEIYTAHTFPLATAYSYVSLITATNTEDFVDVSMNMPNVKVDEFLRAIIERFNLAIYTTLDEPTIMNIEPWSDWMDASNVTVRDWTEVIDADTVRIMPTTEYQKQRYEFSDAPGANFPNRYWQETFNWVKGKYEYISENDFAALEGKTSQIFQPYRNRQLYSNFANTGVTQVPNVLLPCFWDWHDGSDASIYLKEHVKNKPVLAFYHGLQDIGQGNAYMEFGGVEYQTYPYFSEYDTVGVDGDSQVLHWGYDYPDNLEAPFVGGSGTDPGLTTRYLFNEYWSDMFNQLYSPDSRVMTCMIRLDYSEFNQLRFNDNLFWDGAYWRVIKIDNYTIGGERLAKATLLKVIAQRKGRISSQCDLTVTSINTNGTVNFENADGVSAPATQECCVLNGYIWDSRRNQCFARVSGGVGGAGGGGGNNGGGVGFDTYNPQTNRGNNKPTPFRDFNQVEIKPFTQKGQVGADITTNLTASTSGTTPVSARQANNVRYFKIPIETTMYLRLQVVATETGGTGATVGNTSTQNLQFTVSNNSDGKSAIARQVGTTVKFAESKDIGTTPTVDVSVTQPAANMPAFFEVVCTGQTNINYSFFIDVQLTATNNASRLTLQQQVFFNLDPVRILGLDLTPGEPLYFNL
jgi:hypothetical protein